MLDKNKLEKLKNINNDDSDLVLKFNEYIMREIPYNNEDVYSDFDSITLEDNEEVVNIVFTNKKINIENAHIINNAFSMQEEIMDDTYYYFGKKYDEKLNSLKIEKELIERTSKCERIKFIFDIEDISTFPLWETKMYRRIVKVLAEINNIEEEKLTKKFLYEIVHSSEIKNIENSKQYDIDLIITYIKELSKEKEVSAIYITNNLNSKEKFLIGELKKLIYAVNLKTEERNEYIYNTTYKDMNEMFSKYGFCNFKENKCLSQRHKSIFNRYPVPKTDGCCFKVVNKCKHNNKDGTCKVECLPCKLFSCMYLSSLGVGLRIGELILMRAFLNQKQRRLLIYKFYQPKEYFMKRM